jgi:hypothetical protein
MVSSKLLENPATVRITDGFRLTPPAIVTLIGYLLLVVVVLVPFDMFVWDADRSTYVRYKYNLVQRLLLLLLLAFPLILTVYSVNCLVVGKCLAWSWIVALVTIIWAVAVVIAAVMNKAFYLDDIQTQSGFGGGAAPI